MNQQTITLKGTDIYLSPKLLSRIFMFIVTYVPNILILSMQTPLSVPIGTWHRHLYTHYKDTMINFFNDSGKSSSLRDKLIIKSI